jgi:hypothetical protein
MAPRLAAAVGLVLAAALVVPATAATPKAGSWSGSTKQDKSISFKVTPGGGKVKKVKFGFKAQCDNGARTTGTTNFSGKFNVDGGEFTARGGSSVVKGEFTSKKKAEGTLKARSTYFDPITYRSVPCTSGKVGWTAKH